MTIAGGGAAYGLPMGNLSLWLDPADLNADGIAETGSDPVGHWYNKAGNSFSDVGQSTDDRIPWRDPTALNGHPGVIFTVGGGTYDYLVGADPGTDSPLDVTTQMHVFAVASFTSTYVGYDGVLCKGYGGGDGGDYIVEGLYPGADYASAYLGANGWSYTNPGAVAVDTPLIIEVLFDASLPAGEQVKFYINGAFAGQAAAGSALVPNDDPLFIGMQGSYSPMDGTLGDVLLYKGVLNDADRNSVGFYLQQKYGITGDYVPEPASLLVLALGSLALLRCRRI